MGLRNLTFAEKQIEIPGGGAFAVRGLDPDMVLSLYARHSGQLSQLFDAVLGRGDLRDPGALAFAMLSDAPAIMAELIAIANGSTSAATHVEQDVALNPLGLTDFERDVEAARRLPLPVQVDALVQIAELTFSSSMPVGKFLAVVVQMAGTTTAVLNPPKG